MKGRYVLCWATSIDPLPSSIKPFACLLLYSNTYVKGIIVKQKIGTIALQLQLICFNPSVVQPEEIGTQEMIECY